MSDLSLVSGPLSLYWAPVGTAMPAIGVDPGAEWTLIGTSGADNYTEDGVILAPAQTISEFTPLGRTYPTKAFRTNETLTVTVTVADLSLDQVRLALNQNEVVVDAVTGNESIDLERGLDVATMALLVRGVGKSPGLEGGNLQFELSNTYIAGAQSLAFVKGEPVGVLLEFHALAGTNGVGTLRVAIPTTP